VRSIGRRRELVRAKLNRLIDRAVRRGENQ
jgi:hypothetical protein